MSDHKFRFFLGEPVVDVITGFKGVVVYRSRWLYSGDTYGVQGCELFEGKPTDIVAFDEAQIVPDSTRGRVKIIPGPDATVELGNIVKDNISTFQGMVTGISEWMNGCLTVRVACTELKKDNDEIKDSGNFDMGQLEFIEESGQEPQEIVDEEEVVEEVEPVAPRANRGGPVRQVANRAGF